jgi:hypothetical protein
MGVLAGLPNARKGMGSGWAAALEQGLDLPKDDYQAPSWLRYARTVCFDGYSPPVYPHPKDFDGRRLVKIVVELGGDTLRFQPIGYWAYYPSKVFRVHPELGNRDLIDEVARECRRLGVHLYCYTGYGHPHMEIGWVEQHPQYADWVLRDADGKPYGTIEHIGWMKLQPLCTTGEAYRQAIRQVVRELCEHDIDGVYFDGPSGFQHVCFCDSTRRNFKKFSGMDLERLSEFAKSPPYTGGRVPNIADMDALTAWYQWVNQLTKEDLLDFRKILHGSGKFMLCHNGASWWGSALALQYRVPEGFMVEDIEQTYQRLITGLMGASMARPYQKLAQMYLGGYALGQPPHTPSRVVHDTDLEDGDEVRMEGFTDLACGNAPIYLSANRLYFRIGSGSDQPAREVFELMRRGEGILKDSVPVPYVTIVQTWESQQLWRSKRTSWNVMMSEGFGLTMLDERISFDVNPSTEMSEEWLRGQRVIALCGASGISGENAKKLTGWVERGGALLATYDTGLYDEEGQLRHDGGAFKEVLGIEIKGEPLDGQPECYYRVQRAHPALGEYGEGTLVLGDERLVPVEAREGAMVLADCWNLGTQQSRGPAIIVNTYGKGRTIYISGSLEAHYAPSRVASIRRLFGSMVRYLAGGAPVPFKLSGPRGVYGVLRRAANGDQVLWVLANVGFKDADIGRMRQEFVPVSNVEVGIRVPEGQQVKSVELLRAGRSVPFKQANGYAIATLPSLHIAELMHFKLG